jgi:hypothetical protein
LMWSPMSRFVRERAAIEVHRLGATERRVV